MRLCGDNSFQSSVVIPPDRGSDSGPHVADSLSSQRVLLGSLRRGRERRQLGTDSTNASTRKGHTSHLIFSLAKASHMARRSPERMDSAVLPSLGDENQKSWRPPQCSLHLFGGPTWKLLPSGSFFSEAWNSAEYIEAKLSFGFHRN